MPWYYAVAERDHNLQDPTSPEKIRQLGELLRLGRGTRVLDIGCGKAGPALVLAQTFDCTITLSSGQTFKAHAVQTDDNGHFQVSLPQS